VLFFLSVARSRLSYTFFRTATVTDLTPSSDRLHAVALHFAVVDAYCVDLFRAVSTCPPEPSSLLTLRSDMSLPVLNI
jgi:hypothetical protein